MHYCTAVQYSNFGTAQCLRLCCDPLKTLLNLAQHLIMKTIHYHQYSNETLYGIKSDTVRYTWAGYFIFIFTSSLLGNTTILIASIKYRAFKLHRVLIVIIQHIALCDLMVSLSDTFQASVSVMSGNWVFGNFQCYLLTHTRYYFNSASMLLICIMTTTKLLLLKIPLRFEIMSVKKAHISCGVCWLAASTLPLTMLLVDNWEPGRDVYFSYRGYSCSYGFSSDMWHWLRPSLAVSFVFIPNGVVVVNTIYLLVIAKQVVRRGRQSLKRQGVMTAVLTATVYSISFLPYAIYLVRESIIVTADDKSSSLFHTSYYKTAVSFLYLNTISNFYIYSLSVKSFTDFL